MDKKDELPTPGLEVRFIDKIEEVTDFIQEEVSKTGDPLKAFDPAFLDKMAKEKVGEKFLAENPFTEISIKPFFGGNRFFMFTMKVYKDIRFVGAPPLLSGNSELIRTIGCGHVTPETSLFSGFIPMLREIRQNIQKTISPCTRKNISIFH